MKAFILCAGYGTRLKPLTEKIPKPLVSIWGKPVLEHIILRLKKTGIKEFVINLHHLGDMIKRFIDEKESGLNFYFSYEPEILDTGGALKKAQSYLSDTDFVLHNGDIISDINIMEMIEFHKNSKNDVTLGIMQRESSRKLSFDENMLLSGWVNTENNIKDGKIFEKNLFSFSGIHIISPSIFKFMPTDDKFGIFDFYLKNLENLKISGFEVNYSYWYDIGDLDKLEKIRSDFAKIQQKS